MLQYIGQPPTPTPTNYCPVQNVVGVEAEKPWAKTIKYIAQLWPWNLGLEFHATRMDLRGWWEFPFASFRDTVNTKEGVGTMLLQYIWHTWWVRISRKLRQEKRSLCLHVQSLSCVWLFATPQTVAHQVPPSMEFFRQEYWSGLLFPPPGKEVRRVRKKLEWQRNIAYGWGGLLT